MSERNDNTLAKTQNVLVFEGELKEKGFTFFDEKGKTVTGVSDIYDNRVNRIGGDIAVRIGEDVYKIGINCFKNKSNGEPNQMYENYAKYITDEYIAADSVEGREQGGGTTVRVNCALSPTIYYKGNEKKSGLFINLNAMSRKELKEEDFTVSGKVEGAIRSMEPETIINEDGDKEETGQLIIDVAGVGFKGNYLPFKLYMIDDIVEDFQDLYEIGDTGLFKVTLVREFIDADPQPEPETGFGGNQDKYREVEYSKGSVTQKLICFQGSLPYREEYGTEAKAINIEDLKVAIQDYEDEVEQNKNNANNQKSGMAKGGGLKSKAKNAKAKQNIPF